MGRILLSICAVVVAVGLAGAQQGPERQQPTQQGQAASEQRANVAPVRPVVAERQREPREDQGKTAREANDIAKRDLNAQQAMAWLAGLQLALTGLGLWLIKGTLDATREAVADTGEATRAMQEANELARLAQRPYLVVNEISNNARAWKGYEGVLVWTYKIGNYGSVPALISGFVETPFVSRTIGGRERMDGRPTRNGVVIAAGEVLEIEVEAPVYNILHRRLTSQERAAKIKGTVDIEGDADRDLSAPLAPNAYAFWLVVEVRYTGVLDNTERVTAFARTSSGGFGEIEEAGGTPYNYRT